MVIFNKYFKEKRLLSIDPSSSGFGYAVMEGKYKLIDWGTKRIPPHDSKKFMRKAESIIGYFQPDIIVTEDYKGKGSRRCRRIQGLINNISRLAKKRRIKVLRFSRDQIRQTFAKTGSLTKHDIAIEISSYFPHLIPRLPRHREPWMSEDNRMNVFDAVSLALTYLRDKSN